MPGGQARNPARMLEATPEHGGGSLRLPQSRHRSGRAGRLHAKDEVKRTIMRLSVTGRLVETKHKYSLAPLPESDQG